MTSDLTPPLKSDVTNGAESGEAGLGYGVGAVVVDLALPLRV